jgi:T5SS/PEP-CTERM-associated repeat protein
MFKRIADDGHHTMLSRRRHMLRGSTALCAFIVALSFAGDAEAQSWLGGDGNWNEAAKWNPAGAPSAASSVFIGVTGDLGTITINTPDAAARGFTLEGGSELQVNGAGVLNTFAGISTIGRGGLGDGSMLIDGTGARWNATNGVRVGNGAAGTLTVSTGGALNMTGGLLSVGLNASGNGTLNINGGSIANGESASSWLQRRDRHAGHHQRRHAGHVEQHRDQQHDRRRFGRIARDRHHDHFGRRIELDHRTGALVLGSGADSLGRLTITDGGKLSYQNANGAVIVGYLGGTGEVLVSGANSLFESLAASPSATRPDRSARSLSPTAAA